MTETVLRVLTGRLAGSEISMEADKPLTIGRDYDADVVLRDAGGADVLCTLTLSQEGCGTLAVERGTVQLLGQDVSGPANLVLPCFVPVRVCGFALACGPKLSSRWAEAEALAGVRPVPVAVAAQDEEEQEAESQRSGLLARLAGLRPQSINPRLFLGGGIALSLMLAVPPALGAFTSPDRAVQIIDQALSDRGYGGLQVDSSLAGEVAVTGTVPAEADRMKVNEIVALSGAQATVAVTSGEAMADAVAAVFRANGVSAEGRYAGGGIVRLIAAPMAGDRRERLTKLALKDVAGVSRVDVVAGTPRLRLPGGNGGGSAAELNAKRVASVVSGPDGYVVTADGTRYFPGGILPTGHQVIAIENQAVTLEQAGRTTRLVF